MCLLDKKIKKKRVEIFRALPGKTYPRFRPIGSLLPDNWGSIVGIECLGNGLFCTRLFRLESLEKYIHVRFEEWNDEYMVCWRKILPYSVRCMPGAEPGEVPSFDSFPEEEVPSSPVHWMG